jgi:alpha-L-fucosidase 2
MGKTRREFLKSAVTAAVVAGLPPVTRSESDAPIDDRSSTLMWYRTPAEHWMDALPVGNGRLGAMVFGGVVSERLQLNDDTLWSGPPQKDWNNPEARQYLSEIRQLLLEKNDYPAANELTKKLQGPYNESYQPLGNLYVTFANAADASDYRRELDLETGVITISYTVAGARFERTIFSSFPDGILVIRLTCDKPESLSFSVHMDSQLHASSGPGAPDELVLQGKAPMHVDPNYLTTATDPVVYDDTLGKGMCFEARVKLMTTGGRVTHDKDRLSTSGASAATLMLTTRTGYKGFGVLPDGSPQEIALACQERLAAAANKPYIQLLQDHIADHRSLFGRVSLNLEISDASTRPTNQRLLKVREDDEPQLAALYFQFARYLLIASSRPGTQPANLQGIWNQDIRPPWSSNWTLNINAQMNYWMAESCNLADCHTPLFNLIDHLSVTGIPTAQVYYGLDGWTAHHNTDLWAEAPPVGDGTGDPTWANWPMGGAWLCQHLWEHYQFSHDDAWLRKHGYPAMKGAALFMLNWLIPDGDRLVTAPSVSPENHFIGPNGKPVAVSIASTMDMAIISDLFTNCISATTILNEDLEFRRKLEEARSHLFPFQIGKYGQLQEWSEDFTEATPGIGHVSHLFPVYPGHEISPVSTPDFAKAAGVSLDRRIEHGAGGGEWPCAWYVCIWARLGEAEKAHLRVSSMLKHSATQNLFNGNYRIFQIDGNFGTAAGIAEMLLQSHDGVIAFLPALPNAWSRGAFKGFRARSAVEVDLAWSRGRAISATLRPGASGSRQLRAPRGQEITSIHSGGQPVRFSQDKDGTVSATLIRRQKYDVRFSE